MNATDMHTSLYRNQQRRIDRAEHPANKDHILCPNKNIETNQAIVEQPPPKKKNNRIKKTKYLTDFNAIWLRTIVGF